MVNPDGVIIGNYRTCFSGNDLNRKYHNPDDSLHPTVHHIKGLIHKIILANGNLEQDDPNYNDVFAFIDMHGHSRKKNVFIYGPYFPLHTNKYFRMRVIPKLLSEQTQMFRFYSCKFKVEKSKEKAARIVLWREFDVMNCFTLEASFFGYFDEEHNTQEFKEKHFEDMGEHLANSLYEYLIIMEEEERIKL